MAKFLILETTQAAGQRPENGEVVNGLFRQGDDITGEIINQNGFTLIADNVYWQFPTERLFPIDQPEVTMELQQTRLTSSLNNGNKPIDPNTGKPKEPIWKHPEMPKWIGAGVGALLGMRVSDKVPVLPGPLNWILFTGLGILGGYKGTDYLVNKIKGLPINKETA